VIHATIGDLCFHIHPFGQSCHPATGRIQLTQSNHLAEHVHGLAFTRHRVRLLQTGILAIDDAWRVMLPEMLKGFLGNRSPS